MADSAEIGPGTKRVAAANVTGLDEFVVIGSQAILGGFEQPPEEMLHSLEVDIYPLRDPRGADLIDGALGDGSQFHVAFGCYAHGVGPETAKAPARWQKRLVKRRVPLSTGFGRDDRRLHKIDRTGLTIGRDDFGLSPSRLRSAAVRSVS